MPERAVDTLPSGRLDLSRYYRTPGFTQKEQLRIAAVAEGESLHLRLDDPLARLLDPLKACLRLTEAQQSQHSLLRHLVAEMHAIQMIFWLWRDKEWTSVYHRCKEARTTANTLQHVLAMAALLCGVDLPRLRNQERRILCRRSLAIKVFGREKVDRSIDQVQAELKRLGYTGYFHLEVRNPLCELFLVHGTADVRTLTAQSLEGLRCQQCAYSLKQATFMLSHAFVALGIMPSPLRPYMDPQGAGRQVEHRGIDPEWLSWCNRWYETSTLRPSTRKSTRSRLLVTGRWLKIVHPEFFRPDQWTRQLAAEHVAASGQFRVGELVDDKRTSYPDRLLSVFPTWTYQRPALLLYRSVAVGARSLALRPQADLPLPTLSRASSFSQPAHHRRRCLGKAAVGRAESGVVRSAAQ